MSVTDGLPIVELVARRSLTQRTRTRSIELGKVVDGLRLRAIRPYTSGNGYASKSD